MWSSTSNGGEDGGDGSNLNKKRRVYEENEGADFMGKKLKMLERNDDEFCVVLEETGSEKKERIENGEMESTEFGIDLNVVLIDSEDDEPVPAVADRKIEIFDIPSDESEDEKEGQSKQVEVKRNYGNAQNFDLGLGLMEENFGGISCLSDGKRYSRKEKGKAPWLSLTKDEKEGQSKQVEVKRNYGNAQNFDLGLGLMEENFGGISCLSDGKRYSRKEEGIAKVVDPWLSLTTSPSEFELQRGIQESIDFQAPPGGLELVQFDARQGIQESIDLKSQLGSRDLFPLELQPGHQESIKEELRRAHMEMERDRQLELKRRGRKFARSEDYGEASSIQEKASLEDDSALGKLPGSFSDALKTVRDRKSGKNEQLIAWEPSSYCCNRDRPPVPSLLDLSLKVLAENAGAIVSLELVPDFLRQRLADTICNLRGMNIHTFELFVKGSPSEIWIKDSSWLTHEQFLNTFRKFDGNNLTILQLELCGQCTLDDHVISKNLGWSSQSLPNLGVISLKGACRLSDSGLKAILASTPMLKSINLSQCSLLTNDGINILADTSGSRLRELYISDCQKIDPMLILPALQKFEYLEVLSVAGIQAVSDQFLVGLITKCGKTLKELDLADCLGLTDSSLQIIGNTCTGLRSLNISNLDKLTDLGLQFLANGCRYIQKLKLCRNKFSDEAIAAFLEASGKCLKELSLNNVTLVGPCTAFSLAKCSRQLSKLDLSWCRKITNEALGLIVDSCLSLKLVKIFGCTQITSVFSNGHSNPQVVILGLQLTPIFGSANVDEPWKVV